MALSVQGVLIRLTEERWRHIIVRHPSLKPLLGEVLAAVERPQRVFLGSEREFLATRPCKALPHLVVVYRIDRSDGFVITAFDAKSEAYFRRRKQIWP